MPYQRACKIQQRAGHASPLHDIAGKYEERQSHEGKGIKGIVAFLHEQSEGNVVVPAGCKYRNADGRAYVQREGEPPEQQTEKKYEGWIHVAQSPVFSFFSTAIMLRIA